MVKSFEHSPASKSGLLFLIKLLLKPGGRYKSMPLKDCLDVSSRLKRKASQSSDGIVVNLFLVVCQVKLL